MLPKKNRLDKKAVGQVFQRGKSINSSLLQLKFILESNATLPHISFIVPKTIFKKAVKRNSLRRIGYNALKAHMSALPKNIIGVFIFKSRNATKAEIEENIRIILNRI